MRHRALALHPPPLYFCGRGEWGWVCKLAALRRHTQRWWSSWVHLHFSPLVERRLCQKERGEVLFYCFSAGWNLQTTSSAQHKSCRSVLNMLMLDVNELQASLNFTTSATWCIKLCFINCSAYNYSIKEEPLSHFKWEDKFLFWFIKTIFSNPGYKNI
jgi:hypothetical protein